MDSLRFMKSSFWQWHQRNRMGSVENARRQRKEALEILLKCLISGEIDTLDGVDTPLSFQIKAYHGTSKFEMNRNWIGSAQDWTCPCCDRSKFDISRLGQHGQIIAKLTVHHDHMGDALDAAFNRAFELHGSTEAQVEGSELVNRMAPAFAAYEKILICEDCNAADTEAKKLIGEPEFFSFSVGQIRRFIDPKPHRSHKIKPDKVLEEWGKSKPAFDLRMSLIQTVATAAATNSHWYEPYARGAVPVPVLGHGFRFGDTAIQESVAIEELFAALKPKERTGTPDRSRWRTVAGKRGKPLPSNFLAMLRSREDRALAWDSLPSDWRCPVCKRSKEETVYVGSRGEMKFYPSGMGPHTMWAPITHICNHCQSILMSLKMEATEVSGVTPSSSYGFVTPDELSGIIIARPHSEHSVDPGKASALLVIVVDRFQSGEY